MGLSNGKSLQNNNLHNNKYHFLFSFLYWSLIQIQSRIARSSLVFSILEQHIQNLSRFLRSVGQEGGLSVARFVCGPVGESGWGTVRQWDCGEGVQCPQWPPSHLTLRGPVGTVALYPLWSSTPSPTVIQFSGGTVFPPGPGHQGSGGSGSAQPRPTGVCQVWVSGRGQVNSAVATSPPLLGLRRVRQKINKNR